MLKTAILIPLLFLVPQAHSGLKVKLEEFGQTTDGKYAYLHLNIENTGDDKKVFSVSEFLISAIEEDRYFVIEDFTLQNDTLHFELINEEEFQVSSVGSEDSQEVVYRSSSMLTIASEQQLNLKLLIDKEKLPSKPLNIVVLELSLFDKRMRTLPLEFHLSLESLPRD